MDRYKCFGMGMGHRMESEGDAYQSFVIPLLAGVPLRHATEIGNLETRGGRIDTSLT